MPRTPKDKKKAERPFMSTGRLYKDKKLQNAVETMRERKKLKDAIEQKHSTATATTTTTKATTPPAPSVTANKKAPNSIRITNSRLQYVRSFDSGEIIDSLVTNTEKLKDSKMYLSKLTKLLKAANSTERKTNKLVKQASKNRDNLEEITIDDALKHTEYGGMSNIPSNVAGLVATLTENLPKMEKLCSDSITLTNRLIEMHEKFVMRVKHSDSMIEEVLKRLFSEIKALNTTINHLNSGQQLRSFTYTVPVHHGFESGPTVATVSVPEDVVTLHTPEVMASMAHRSRPWLSTGAEAPSSNQKEYGVVNPFSSERSVDHLFYLKKHGDRISIPTRRE
jgi:hypothetical protein